jgi:hypothetical protein
MRPEAPAWIIAGQLSTAADAAFRLFGPDAEINLMVFTDRPVWNTRLDNNTRTPVHMIASRRNWRNRTLVPTLFDRVGRVVCVPANRPSGQGNVSTRLNVPSQPCRSK